MKDAHPGQQEHGSACAPTEPQLSLTGRTVQTHKPECTATGAAPSTGFKPRCGPADVAAGAAPQPRAAGIPGSPLAPKQQSSGAMWGDSTHTQRWTGFGVRSLLRSQHPHTYGLCWVRTSRHVNVPADQALPVKYQPWFCPQLQKQLRSGRDRILKMHNLALAQCVQPHTNTPVTMACLQRIWSQK